MSDPEFGQADDTALTTVGAQLVVARAPALILEEAHKAARALKDVVDKKPNPVIFNGERYLEFEDWQTFGRFYGVTAKVTNTAFVEYPNVQGFTARAVAVRTDGVELSAAEADCLNDEKNWRGKPFFQLKSMAQTRACAKALRNVLAWGVVLAGYRPTPAEEMQELGAEAEPPGPGGHGTTETSGTTETPDAKPAKGHLSSLISEKQMKRFFAIAKSKGWTSDGIRSHLQRRYHIQHSMEIRVADYDQLITEMEQGPNAARADEESPF